MYSAFALDLVIPFYFLFLHNIKYSEQEQNTSKWSIYHLMTLSSQSQNTQQFEHFPYIHKWGIFLEVSLDSLGFLWLHPNGHDKGELKNWLTTLIPKTMPGRVMVTKFSSPINLPYLWRSKHGIIPYRVIDYISCFSIFLFSLFLCFLIFMKFSCFLIFINCPCFPNYNP